MEGHLRVSIHLEGRPPFSQAFAGVVELGRLDPNRAIPEELLVPSPAEGVVRIPIAELAESDVSRRQVRVEPLDGGHVRLTNLSHTVAIRCLGRPDVPPGRSAALPLPLGFRIGRCALSVELEGGEGTVLHPEVEYLPLPTPTPSAAALAATVTAGGVPAGGVPADAAAAEPAAPLGRLAALDPRDATALVHGWRRLVALLVCCPDRGGLFAGAVAGLVDLLGLDLAAVFVREDEDWRPAALTARERSRMRPGTAGLDRVAAEGRTLRSQVDPGLHAAGGTSLEEVHVAAPILDRAGRLAGVLYGQREGRAGDPDLVEITEAEALVVETIACGLAAALGRLDDPA